MRLTTMSMRAATTALLLASASACSSAGGLGSILGSELEFAYAKNFFGDIPGVSTSVLTLMGNGMVAPRFGPVQPYWLIGLGLMKTHVDFSATTIEQSENHFAWDTGGGLIIFFGRNVGARGTTLSGMEHALSFPLPQERVNPAFDKKTERYTIQVPTQGVSGNRAGLAKNLKVPNEKVHLLTANVGGSFGPPNVLLPTAQPSSSQNRFIVTASGATALTGPETLGVESAHWVRPM